MILHTNIINEKVCKRMKKSKYVSCFFHAITTEIDFDETLQYNNIQANS